MRESIERMVYRMDKAKEYQAQWSHAWAVGYNDAVDGAGRAVWKWTNFERGAYHDGWMTRMGAR